MGKVHQFKGRLTNEFRSYLEEKEVSRELVDKLVEKFEGKCGNLIGDLSSSGVLNNFWYFVKRRLLEGTNIMLERVETDITDGSLAKNLHAMYNGNGERIVPALTEEIEFSQYVTDFVEVSPGLVERILSEL